MVVVHNHNPRKSICMMGMKLCKWQYFLHQVSKELNKMYISGLRSLHTHFCWCTCWHPKQTIRHKKNQDQSRHTNKNRKNKTPQEIRTLAWPPRNDSFFMCDFLLPPQAGLSLFSLCLGIPLPNATPNISYNCAGALLAHTFPSMHVCSANGTWVKIY